MVDDKDVLRIFVVTAGLIDMYESVLIKSPISPCTGARQNNDTKSKTVRGEQREPSSSSK